MCVLVVAVEQIAVYLTNFFSTQFSGFRFQKCKNVQWLLICRQDTDKQTKIQQLFFVQKLPR